MKGSWHYLILGEGWDDLIGGVGIGMPNCLACLLKLRPGMLSKTLSHMWGKLNLPMFLFNVGLLTIGSLSLGAAPMVSKSGAIYWFQHGDLSCDDEYIGETPRIFGERFKELGDLW